MPFPEEINVSDQRYCHMILLISIQKGIHLSVSQQEKQSHIKLKHDKI